MRLRTNIIITWGGLLILLWAGTFWPVQWLIARNARSAENARLDQTLRSLRGAEAERVERMRQGCRLMMTIPELRALIDGQRLESPEQNVGPLTERLDALRTLMDASCVCVLDTRAGAIAQNTNSPWPSLGDLRTFLAESPQASALVTSVFAAATQAASRRQPIEVWGLWSNGRDLYHVVGVPLIFEPSDGARPRADGALITAIRVSDDLATTLSRSQGCETTFIAAGYAVASSLPSALRQEIERSGPVAIGGTLAEPFEMSVGGQGYRSALQPLIDPCSGAPVGAVLVQSNLAESRRLRESVATVFLLALAGGLVATWAAACVAERVIEKFSAQLSDVAGRLRHAVDAADATELAKSAHALKGAAAMTSAEGVGRFAESLEKLGREGRVDDTDELLGSLQEQIDHSLAFIHQRPTADQSPPAPVPVPTGASS